MGFRSEMLMFVVFVGVFFSLSSVRYFADASFDFSIFIFHFCFLPSLFFSFADAKPLVLIWLLWRQFVDCDDVSSMMYVYRSSVHSTTKLAAYVDIWLDQFNFS